LLSALNAFFSGTGLADFCNEHKIPFILGHALYMKAIHASKSKNDKIDSFISAVFPEPFGPMKLFTSSPKPVRSFWVFQKPSTLFSLYILQYPIFSPTVSSQAPAAWRPVQREVGAKRGL
jgi:hypothetical protein